MPLPEGVSPYGRHKRRGKDGSRQASVCFAYQAVGTIGGSYKTHTPSLQGWEKDGDKPAATFNFKIMRITVLNREQAENANFDDKTFVISIYTPGDTKPKINAKHVAYFKFHDLSDENLDGKKLGETVIHLFSSMQAKKMYSEIKKYAPIVDTIVVHCDAGISRSAGVAVFLESFLNNRAMDKTYPLYNKHVYLKLLEARINEMSELR